MAFFSKILKKNIRKNAFKIHSGETIKIADSVVTRLSPLGNPKTPGITKAKRLSFRGYINGQKVKVYSGFSSDQVALRLALQNKEMKGMYFPKIIASNERLVAEEWIEGSPINDEIIHRAQQNVLGFFEYIHSDSERMDFIDKHSKAFCYFEDYLLKRIGEWRYLSSIEKFLSLWADEYRKRKSIIPIRLSHPDLSKANLIKQKSTNNIYSIDNELVGVGRGWVLDLRNSLLGMNCMDNNRYFFNSIKDFVELSWSLRRIGSALDNGEVNKAIAIADSYQQ